MSNVLLSKLDPRHGLKSDTENKMRIYFSKIYFFFI